MENIIKLLILLFFSSTGQPIVGSTMYSALQGRLKVRGGTGGCALSTLHCALFVARVRVRCACACAGLQGETRGAAGSAAGSALEGNLLRSSFKMCSPPAENLWPGELEMQVASQRGQPGSPSFLKTSVNHSIKFRSEQ